MIYESPFDKLSYYANTALVEMCSYRSSKALYNKYATFGDFDENWGQKTYEWVLLASSKIFYWLEEQNISGKYFEKNIQESSTDYLGYYHEKYQPREYHALNCCYHAIAFSCLVMIEYDKLQGLCPMDYFPSSLQEYPRRIHECLSSAQQASEDSEAEKIWQDQIIDRLLKDHYTEYPDDFGGNISREYIEELLGEKLLF